MKNVIWIKLEIKGDADEAMEVVERVLDNGDLQDAIGSYASDQDIDLEVTLALGRFSPGEVRFLGAGVSAVLAEVARVRAKIAERIESCDPNCPGWAVFNADSDPSLQRCDECWSDVEQRLKLTDDEVRVLPEAIHELSLAVDFGIYDAPDIGPPCKCGCTVSRHVANGQTRCSGCGELSGEALSKRPLSAKTMRRIAAAVKKYGLDKNPTEVFVDGKRLK